MHKSIHVESFKPWAEGVVSNKPSKTEKNAHVCTVTCLPPLPFGCNQNWYLESCLTGTANTPNVMALSYYMNVILIWMLKLEVKMNSSFYVCFFFWYGALLGCPGCPLTCKLTRSSCLSFQSEAKSMYHNVQLKLKHFKGIQITKQKIKCKEFYLSLTIKENEC